MMNPQRINEVSDDLDQVPGAILSAIEKEAAQTGKRVPVANFLVAFPCAPEMRT